MVKIAINGQLIEVLKGTTILQACSLLGIEIPRFCYHERLSVAGNCRMCLVEVEKTPKPVASCAMPVLDDMKIFTETSLVKTAREGVLEFLLANHPLDCPICDQGGECDLQDQAMLYGTDRSRFFEYKRAVEDKNCGPFIKTVMNRCIHCTRCVRFATEIAGVETLGVTGRGQKMEIGMYIEKTFNSELSGNIIDLCPVGALTSKPYAFTARSWELRKTESIDILDSIGSNIVFDSRNSEVMRILPRLNEQINEEWLSDKARFAYDGLKRQRLTVPMIRENNNFRETTWEHVFHYILTQVKNISGTEIAAVIGALVDVEAIVVLKDFMSRLGASAFIKIEQDRLGFNANLRVNYLLNTTIQNLDKADLCLLIGINPRMEASLINLRLRKKVLANELKVAYIGHEMNLNYSSDWLGDKSSVFFHIIEGKHSFSRNLAKAKMPLIIFGSSIFQRMDSSAVINSLSLLKNYTNLFNISNGWNGINFIHNNVSKVAAYELGLFNGINKVLTKRALHTFKILYLLGADEINPKELNSASFIIYQGHHGDNLANYANVILPSAAYSEKVATYFNTEGRIQQTQLAFLPPGQARDDWQITRALAEILNVFLPYHTLSQVRTRLLEMAPYLQSYNILNIQSMTSLSLNNLVYGKWFRFGFSFHERIFDSKFIKLIHNFYMTNAITRASLLMAKATIQLNLSY